MNKTSHTQHWTIVISGFLVMAFSVGAVNNCFSVLGPAIMADLGYTASQIQVINMCSSIVSIFASLMVGKVIAKFGIRATMTVAALILCAAYAIRGTASAYWQFCACNAALGLALPAVSTIPVCVLINNWFTDKKGTANGIALAGSVAGGLVLVQVAQRIVTAYDWRIAHFALAIASAIILLPITLLIVRGQPKDRGLVPYGEEEGKAAAAGGGKLTGISSAAFFKTPAFWFLAIAIFALVMANYGITMNITICLQSEYGYDAAFAANIFSIVMGVQIAGKIMLGAIYDKKGIKFGTIYNFVLAVIAAVTMSLAASKGAVYAFAVAFGLLGSMITVTPPQLVATIVGRKHYASIYSILSLFSAAGTLVGPVFGSAIFDKTGSYTPAWIGYGVIAIIYTVFSIVAFNKGKGFAQIEE